MKKNWSKFILSLWLLLFAIIGAYAQPKQTKAIRTDEKIKIDGQLLETSWTNAEISNDFVAFSPKFGAVPGQNSEVKILYDDHSIYFAAVLYDKKPDSIYTELTVRDNDNGNVDYFRISLNPNNDGQNSYEFLVSAANVQTDVRVSDEEYDYSWDAVWYSEVSITENGWLVEVEIPYSAIRFPKVDQQLWAVNFWRTVRRTREKSSWNPVDQNLGSSSSQMGTIQGISKIIAPLRLSLMPYISGYLTNYDKKLGYSFGGGMDLKIGLNETYTLDMTLIPDFGQTKSDEAVLNLTPYETYYSENRPFFTEGTELFNKCGIFYSRRIGKTPNKYYDVINESGDETYSIIKNPNNTRLINAFKISGRGKNNLAIGVFNAITANTWATVNSASGNETRILTEPAANYNIFVIDKSIGKNSYLNFTNANVLSPQSKYISNVSATAFKFMEKSNRFGISSIFSYSNQSNSLGKIADGWYATTSVGKMNGAWVYNLSTEIISNEYNPNDLGYLVEFNEISTSANLGFRKFSQFWIFNETTNNISFSYETLYENAAFASTEIAMSNYATTTNHISIWHDINWQPTNVNDYYEPRIAGRFYDRPASFNDNIFISTDYRKRLAVDFRAMYYADNEERHGFWANISPLTRFGKKISLRYIYSCDYDLDGAGYVDLIGADTIVFGRRNVLTFTNSLNVNYVLTNKLSISLKARHYVSSVDYHSFYYLNMDGSLSPNNDYTEDRDYNFNSFNVDFLFSWNFSPGSYLSIMWKNQIFKSDYIPETELIPSYYDSFKDIWREPQFNSLSLKLIYYLDYNSVLKRY